ncbi:hypothetical protein FSPOR_4343 [Fusarium sporotrichioides]|uniref:Xylanolytic transcriptional activator regulatory domain-containing protein n=1 Tax=Fusarium sporotrichioides TaxID=5514 RepID=A0A395SCB0_FUSSP|nr:hypothetical protein FSPOR_4343 [Fusarium sporotrichioides]
MASGYTGDFIGDYIGTPSKRDDSMSIDSPPVKPSFFGVTGHNEIFEETKNYLSKLDAFSINPDDTSISSSTSNNTIQFKDLPSNIQQACLAVLGCIFGPCYDRLVAHKTKYENRLWSNLTVPAIIRSLELTFGSHLNPEQINFETIAERVCNNTIRPFRDTENSQEWVDQLCGQNLRWESIAMLWSVLRRIPNSFEPMEKNKFHILESGTQNKAALAYLRQGILLARYFTLANVMILDLLQQKTIMESMIIGDASLAVWNSHGEAVTMMTYLGVHAQRNTIPYSPSLSSEHKRRLFGRIYNLDKAIVAFTGRPPLLDARYCTTPSPLDFSDEDLLAGGAVLERATAELDSAGWNTRGGVYPSGICRTGYQMSVILNQILGIALAPDPNTTLETLRDLKQREINVIAQFPKHLIYDPSDPHDLPLPRPEPASHEKDLADPQVEANVIPMRIFARLTHLQNMFLLERLFLQYGALDEGDVLVVSFEMISLTLLFWTHKDKFRDIRRDFEWMLMAFAVPGGGILCQELLQPTFQGRHPKDSRLSRSSIVQNLSLLVGFLDWRALDYQLNDAIAMENK